MHNASAWNYSLNVLWRAFALELHGKTPIINQIYRWLLPPGKKEIHSKTISRCQHMTAVPQVESINR